MKITFLIIICFSENVKFRYPVQLCMLIKGFLCLPRGYLIKFRAWKLINLKCARTLTVTPVICGRERGHQFLLLKCARTLTVTAVICGRERGHQPLLLKRIARTGYRNLTFSLKQKMIRNVIFTGSDRTSYYRPGPAINGPGQSRPVRTNPVAIPYRDEATSGGRGGGFFPSELSRPL